jgi:hypothetical protein
MDKLGPQPEPPDMWSIILIILQFILSLFGIQLGQM